MTSPAMATNDHDTKAPIFEQQAGVLKTFSGKKVISDGSSVQYT